MKRFKQTFAARKPIRPVFGAIGLAAALALVGAPARGQTAFVPPPPPTPPVNIIVIDIPPPRPVPVPVYGTAGGDLPVRTITTSPTTTPTTTVTPLGWYLMGGIFFAAASPIVGTIVLNRELTQAEVWTSTLTAFLGPVGWIIAQQMFPPGSEIGPVTQPVSTSSPGGGHHATNRGQSNNSNQSGFNNPPRGALYVRNELVVSTEAGTDTDQFDAAMRRLRLTRLESFESILTGRTFHRLRINSKASVTATGPKVARQSFVFSVQPNYIFRLSEDRPTEAKGDPDQYAISKLHLPEAHRIATGKGVSIAVIDSEIDAAHPDLAGAVSASFEASDPAEPHPHGTGMAGAIASHSRLLGVAPGAKLLAVRAFGKSAAGPEGTSFRILKGLDWAANQNARIVNMSFAGPNDPALHEALEGAHDRGMVLVAAAGNAGARSPPLHPAADAIVIAVTATDADDELFPNANRGRHVAVAAPGVDILVPAPREAYQLTSGTSVAAAEVSGVVALLLERNPALKPDEIRKILIATAKHLGSEGRNAEFGAGLVDPREALEMAPRGVSWAR
jgi:subtilisin family serine protease